MAVPFRRTSITRKRLRRTHHKLTPPTLTKCNHCDEFKLAHHVCSACGWYKNRQIHAGS